MHPSRTSTRTRDSATRRLADLDARVSSLEARLDESEATIARLESTLSILGGHPMTMIEVVNTAPAPGVAVCPNEAVLVGGGCACADTAQIVRSMPSPYGCSTNDQSCVRAWQCECSSGNELVRADVTSRRCLSARHRQEAVREASLCNATTITPAISHIDDEQITVA